MRIVDLFPDRQDGSDVSDWIVKDTAGVRLAKLVTEADEWEPSGPATSADDAKPDEEESEISIEISRLAKLPVIKYEQERKAAAEALGVRASVLDRLVQDERARLGDDDDQRHAGPRDLVSRSLSRGRSRSMVPRCWMRSPRR